MSDQPKKKGGKREGSGRKPKPAPVTIIDGRTITGSQHAQSLIDQLNAIDPEIMEHRALLVSGDPYKVPKDAPEEIRKDLENMEAQRKVLLAAKNAAEAKFQKLSYEVQGWAVLWFAARTALEARKYLYDRAKGKAVITVNHVHDKPQEVNFNLRTISERFRVAMQKADARVINGRAG